jgi:adenylate cyclase class 2
MLIEYEATFININKEEMRERLKRAGAVLVRPEYLQKRIPFDLPGDNIGHKWIRVRDEGDKVTLSLKEVDGEKIENQKEICIQVSDFNDAVEILELIGCRRKSFQENKRELWNLDGVEITIDTWPFLESFVEIEGKSEEAVKSISEKLGFDYSTALFGATDVIINKKYGISLEKINNIPKIVFDMENPFL